jgi:hypothetical protein
MDDIWEMIVKLRQEHEEASTRPRQRPIFWSKPSGLSSRRRHSASVLRRASRAMTGNARRLTLTFANASSPNGEPSTVDTVLVACSSRIGHEVAGVL